MGNKEVFTQNPQTERFLEIVDTLKGNKTLESDADLCRSIRYSPQSFNQIRKGKRNVTVELITMFCIMFNVNPNYIILGREPKLSFEDVIKGKIESSPNHIGGEEDLILYIKETLKASDYLKGVLGSRYWYERIAFLVKTLMRLETDNVFQAHEIKILNKLISDNLIKTKAVKHN